MTFDQVVETVDETFVNGMNGTLDPATQIALANETFAMPAGIPWARVTTKETTSQQRALGPAGKRKWARYGQVIVQLFAPLGSGGDKTANQLAEQTRRLFEGVRVSDQLFFREASITALGPDGQAWWQTNVSALFTYQDTH